MTSTSVVSVPITADPQQLDAALRKIEQSLDDLARKGATAGRGVGQGFGAATPQIERARLQSLAFARALAQLQRDSGNAAGAIRTLEGALRGQTQAGTAYIQTQRQIIRLQNEVAAGGSRTAGGLSALRGALGGVTAGLGALGVATSVAALGSLAIDAGRSAVALERTEATLRAVVGSTAAYNDVVRIASANQQLLGGSLQQNLATLQQFAFISNRTGASLQELNRVAQLLAVINPTQGIEGAGFALSELFAGDVTSIVERFNQPRSAIRDLINESKDAGEIITGLTALLAEQGVTNETLAASLTDNAVAYNTLAAEAEEAFNRIGAAAAAAGRPVAEFTAGVLRNFNLIVGKSEEVANLAPQIFALSGSTYADYIAKVNQVNVELSKIGESVIPLAEVQYQFAQGLIATGVAAEQAYARVDAITPTLDLYTQALAQASKSGPDAVAAIAGFEAVITNASLASEEGARQTQLLIQAYLDGVISTEQLAVGLSNVEMTAILAAGAERDAAAAAAELADGAGEAASLLDLEAEASRRVEAALKDVTQVMAETADEGGDLEDQARAAAEALADAGAAGETAANRLAASGNKIDGLVAKYYALEVAARAAQAATGAVSATGNLGGIIKGAGEATAAIRALNRVYGAGPLGGGKPTGGSGSRGGGGGTSTRVSEADKEAKAIAKIAADAQQRIEQAQQAHEQRLSKIAQDGARERARLARDFSDQQFEDRLSFYRSLEQIEDQGIRQQASASFEAAAQEAAQIRDTQGADVAAAFLSAAAQIASARARRDAEIAKARAAGDANVEYLEGLDKLEREIEERRLQRAREGEDSQANREAAQVADANAQLQADLGAAATQAGDAIAEAQRTGTEAISLTNDALLEQIRLLGQVGATRPAGIVPTPATTEGGAVPVAGGAIDLSAVTAGLDAIKRATEDVKRAIEDAARRGPFGG